MTRGQLQEQSKADGVLALEEADPETRKGQRLAAKNAYIMLVVLQEHDVDDVGYDAAFTLLKRYLARSCLE